MLGPLATFAEPHCYDLCQVHADRMTAPRGWEVVRLEPDPDALRPSSDDLEALADAVREAARPRTQALARTSSRWVAAVTCACFGRSICPATRQRCPDAQRSAGGCGGPEGWGQVDPRARDAQVTAVRDLSQIIKAYDVRGVYPDQLDAELADRVGAAFAQVVGAAPALGGPGRSSSAVTCAPPGPELVAAFCAGGHRPGGRRRSTSGWPAPTSSTSPPASLELPGAMFTASHNPAQYNGIKMCRAGATPVGQESGLADDPRARGRPDPARSTVAPGTSSTRDLLAEYAAVPARAGRPDRHPAADGRRRCGQRHGRAHGAGGARHPAA